MNTNIAGLALNLFSLHCLAEFLLFLGTYSITNAPSGKVPIVNNYCGKYLRLLFFYEAASL
jgi:hypothetical protein